MDDKISVSDGRASFLSLFVVHLLSKSCQESSSLITRPSFTIGMGTALDSSLVQVVGVVAHARHLDVRREVRPQIYLPYRTAPHRTAPHCRASELQQGCYE